MKKEIELDELDIRCLNEMPLIVDVLSSTSNKVSKILSSLYKESTNIIKENTKNNWNIIHNDAATHSPIIFPLMSDDYEKVVGVGTEAFAYLTIESLIGVNKMIDNREVNFFHCRIALDCYKNVDNEYENYFSFSINKHNIKKRYNGTINNLKFYETIKKQIANKYEVKIEHEENGDELESIQLFVEDFTNEKIDEAFNTFKELVLLPFLKNLP